MFRFLTSCPTLEIGDWQICIKLFFLRPPPLNFIYVWLASLTSVVRLVLQT